MRVAVIGAGAFGGWTALHLVRSGAKVTLIDNWGPGNSRSSSGDETRVIRGSYGPNTVYTEMTARSLPLWRRASEQWRVDLFHEAGALWMAGDSAAYAEASVESLKAAGLPFTILDAARGAQRFPQMSWEGVRWAILEHHAGYLRARRACQAVWEAVIAEGGATLTANVNPDNPPVEADAYVYATGPWLGAMFPELLGQAITPTRQEIFYFGTPPGDTSFDESRFPAWVDDSGSRFYGIPGNQWRGFKAGRDIAGERVDPTTMDRRPSAEEVERVRQYLGRRFPALAGAPLIESRVCQYEMSPDGHLVVDRHPERPNLWIAGGGSGHSFKFAPALGQHVADLVLERAAPDPRFSLQRLTGVSGVGERK